MDEINKFISKTKGASNISCIVTTPQKIKNVEDKLLNESFMLVNNKVDFYTLSQKGESFFVPVYRLGNLADWYKIAYDYASGQLHDNEMDKRVNPIYPENNIIFVVYENDISLDNKNLFDVLGLTLQVK